jgi:hypothetical protein
VRLLAAAGDSPTGQGRPAVIETVPGGLGKMAERRPDDDILILENELILDVESGGDDAIGREPGVLLLDRELPPEPVVKVIKVGPRVSSFGEAGLHEEREVRSRVTPGRSSLREQVDQIHPEFGSFSVAAVSRRRDTTRTAPSVGCEDASELSRTLLEARTFAIDYGAGKARTRKALYEALGLTYDFTLQAEREPAEYARLVADAGLKVLDRSPWSAAVKLVFGANYDKTRVTEFASAITYGRRNNLPEGSFSAFLDQIEGGLKGVIALERLARRGAIARATGGVRADVRPGLARKLRNIAPGTSDDFPLRGDEFTLLLARRLDDGSVAMIGEVPRDIPLLEKAARKLLADLDRAVEARAEPAGDYPEEAWAVRSS